VKITSEQPEPKEGETLIPVVVDGIPPLRESVWIPKALYSLLLQKGSERVSGECDVIGGETNAWASSFYGRSLFV
jgi:hypothetical protein